MRIAFFEDAEVEGFGPLVLLRPAFELVCGRWSLLERLRRRLGRDVRGAFVRPHLAAAVRERHPDLVVNEPTWLGEGETMLVNARWLPPGDAIPRLRPGHVGVVDRTVVYMSLSTDDGARLADGTGPAEVATLIAGRRFVAAGGVLLRHPWNLVDENSRQLDRDFERPTERYCTDARVLGPLELLSVADDVEIEPDVVLDVRPGPISIESGVVVQAFTRIEGPCHIGRGSRLFRANVRGGTTIGPDCRVGGEVENSILHGRVNKYHDGFLGHAYVCPWVNLGAMTTNSDLRNDYGSVRVPLAGEPIDSGTTKAGVYVGDHTKTAIGTLFNTGSSIGVATTIVPAGELVPRFMPSFASLWRGQLVENANVDAVVETACIVMARRGAQLGPAEEDLLRTVFERTRRHRVAAAERQTRGRTNETKLGRAG